MSETLSMKNSGIIAQRLFKTEAFDSVINPPGYRDFHLKFKERPDFLCGIFIGSQYRIFWTLDGQLYTSFSDVFERSEPNIKEKFLWHMDLFLWMETNYYGSFESIDEKTKYLDELCL